MVLSKLLELCEVYVKLGTAVQEQLRAIENGEPFDEQNPNALRRIADDFLAPLARFAQNVDADDLAYEVRDLVKQFADNGSGLSSYLRDFGRVE